MNITLYIIRKLLSKEAFYKYRKYIKVKEPRELVQMYECLDKQMEQLQRDISLTEYALFVNQQDPSLCSLTEQLLQDDVGEDSLQQMLQIHVDRQWAYDVALKAVAVHEGREEVNALTALTQEAPVLEDVLEEDYFYEGTSKEVLQGIDRRTGGLRWRLRQLDASLGGLQRGDFGFIFARSETGKTTFLVSEISHFATQTEAPVIWFN